MNQIFLHFVGDYMLQNAWMSARKTRSWAVAFLHALVYGIPFLIGLEISFWTWSVLVVSHMLTDRLQLAAFLLFCSNRLLMPYLEWDWVRCNNGFPVTAPVRTVMMVSMAVDSALHLSTNYAIFRWL